MALTRQKKEEIIKNVTPAIKNATSVVFVKFHGFSVFHANEMRRALREKEVAYTVVKKTLLKRALKSAGILGALPPIEGKIAVAYGKDVVEPAKSVALYVKKFGEMIEMLGGILENRYLSQEEIKALAAIPSRQTLLAQLVRVMNAPISQTVRTLHEVSRSFVSVLHQITQSKN